jgi:hypothetical protein
MKFISSSLLLIVLTFLASGLRPLSAQDQTATNSPPANGSPTNAALAPDERAHLRKVQKQVLANDPALKAEDDSLRQQREDLEDQGSSASPDDRKALMAKWHDHQQKVRAAALKLDPTLAPIYAKLDAWRLQHAKPAPAG